MEWGAYPYCLPQLNIQTLTEDENAKAMAALERAEAAATSNDVVLRSLPLDTCTDSVSLLYKQLGCLSTSGLLNDQVVNAFVDMLQWRTQETLILGSFTWTAYSRDHSQNNTNTDEQMTKLLKKRLALFKVHDSSPITANNVTLCVSLQLEASKLVDVVTVVNDPVGQHWILLHITLGVDLKKRLHVRLDTHYGVVHLILAMIHIMQSFIQYSQ